MKNVRGWIRAPAQIFIVTMQWDGEMGSNVSSDFGVIEY